MGTSRPHRIPSPPITSDVNLGKIYQKLAQGFCRPRKHEIPMTTAVGERAAEPSGHPRHPGDPSGHARLAAPKAAVPHVRRSCDLSSLTSSLAHSRASGIFPASLNARAFAKAWLSDDRSAADSLRHCALRGLRAAADMLRIGPPRVRILLSPPASQVRT